MGDGEYIDEVADYQRSLNDATPAEWDAVRSIGREDAPKIAIRKPGTRIDYKFNEGNLIAEFQKYIDSTYTGHYSKNKFQSTEVIIERGHGTGFCMGNVDKYSNRYGKKGTRDDARKDLMKILHYALIQLYIHDTEQD